METRCLNISLEQCLECIQQPVLQAPPLARRFFGTGINQLSFPGPAEALLSGYLLDVAQL
jgi:hypothetical protein